MIYIIIGAFFTLVELLLFGVWIPRSTPLSYFLCSYNLSIWSSLVVGVWIVFAIFKISKNKSLSWMTIVVTFAANIIAIMLSIPSTEGDKTTAIMFGIVFFLVPSVLGTTIITGLSVIIQKIKQKCWNQACVQK